MEARPTLYKGIKYRSKTEAMFAFVMNQRYKELGHRYRLIYEPAIYKTPDNYIPDFREDLVEEPFLADFTSLYEIKPSIPNQTYINYLEKQYKWLKEKDWFESISFYCLYVFNPYKKEFKSILFDFESTPTIEDFERPMWFKEHWFDMALAHRFDLEPDLDF